METSTKQTEEITEEQKSQLEEALDYFKGFQLVQSLWYRTDLTNAKEVELTKQSIQALCAFFHIANQLTTNEIERVKTDMSVSDKALRLSILSKAEVSIYKKFFLKYSEAYNSFMYLLESHNKNKEIEKLEKEISKVEI